MAGPAAWSNDRLPPDSSREGEGDTGRCTPRSGEVSEALRLDDASMECERREPLLVRLKGRPLRSGAAVDGERSDLRRSREESYEAFRHGR